MKDMTETERKDTRMSTLYELRLLISANDKDTYTKKEILELLDAIAIAKETE